MHTSVNLTFVLPPFPLFKLIYMSMYMYVCIYTHAHIHTQNIKHSKTHFHNTEDSANFYSV